MKRLFGSLAAASAGATVGYVVNQVVEQRSQGHKPNHRQIVVGAPLVTTAVATLIGLAGGRHFRFIGFVAGAGIAAFFGDLEALVPALGRSRADVAGASDSA